MAKKALSSMCDFERVLSRLSTSRLSNIGRDQALGAIFYNKNQKSKDLVENVLSCLNCLNQGSDVLKTLYQTASHEEQNKLITVLGNPDIFKIKEVCKDILNKFDFKKVSRG